MKRILSIFLCVLILAVAVSTSVCATTPIDTTRPSSLTLQYARDGKYFEGLTIRTYRIAEVFADGTYALTGDFASYPVKLYDVTSQSEWRSIATTLAAYAEADGIEPTCVGVTDEWGIVSFTDILPGMYLTISVTSVDGATVTIFETFLTVVPYPSEDGNHNYDVTAIPKSDSYTTGGDIEYKVIKLWKDEGASDKRPASVTVDILKDGELKFTQVLSPENNWSYTWKTADDGSVWYVVEREVSEDYTVTVTREGNTFIIVNKIIQEIPEAPQTGDTTAPWPYAVAMFLSGSALIILTTWRKRTEE